MWTMTKRVFLFVTVNILVLISLSLAFSLITNLLGIQPGPYYQFILIFSVLMGFGGAFVSLLISKWMAKTMMRVQIIDPATNDPTLRYLVERVHDLARSARLPAMPEVGFYQSPEINAFATGPSKKNSLVAVSSGLLQRMNRDELDGVLAHEVAHIANGDMVTMTLIQGVINAVVIFMARMVAQVLASQGRSSDDRPNPFMYIMLVHGLETVFSLFGMIVVNYFSRAREFRADSGGAKFAGRDRMIAALRSLQGAAGRVDTSQQALATLKISGRPHSVLMALFSTHPPLEDRIRRLESGR